MSAPVPEVSPLRLTAIEDFASKVLATYYPHHRTYPAAFPVVEFFEHVLPEHWPHLQTGTAELDNGAEGMAYPSGLILVCPKTYAGAVRGEGRDRFTMAHESFHGIQHTRQLKTRLADLGSVPLFRRGVNIKPFRDPEWQANCFASAILMPADAVCALANSLASPLLLVGEMVKTFKVSNSAATVRLKVLRNNLQRSV
jgi:hypothetical protein